MCPFLLVYLFRQILNLVIMQYSVIEVSPNIRLATDEAFGDFNVYIVKEILCYVDMTFSDALQIPCSSIDKCTVRYNYFKDNPMCSNLGNDRIIYLSLIHI